MASVVQIQRDNSGHSAWAAALLAFAGHLAAAGASPSTIRSYGAGARLFAAWCGELMTPGDVTVAHAGAWLSDLAKAGAKPATVRQRRQAVGALLRWLDVSAAAPPMPPLDTPITDSPEPATNLPRLLASITGRDALRDRALVALVIGAGWSPAAVARIRVSDLPAERRPVAMTHAAINKDVTRAVAAFARSVRRAGLGPHSSPWVGRHGPLGADSIRRTVRRRLAAAVPGAAAAPPERSPALAPPARSPVSVASQASKEDGLVLICAPSGEAERLAAAVRALGSSPVIVASATMAAQVFQARPQRFARVIVSGAIQGAEAMAAGCNHLRAGVAQVV